MGQDRLILKPAQGFDYLEWLEIVAPAELQPLFSEANLWGEDGTAKATVHMSPDGHVWMLQAAVRHRGKGKNKDEPTTTSPPTVIVTEPPPPPVTMPGDDPNDGDVVTLGNDTQVITPEPIGAPRAGVNHCLWQRNNDDQEQGVGAPFVFSGIGAEGHAAGQPDVAPDGTAVEGFFPGGGLNPATVWHPGQRKWVHTPDRHSHIVDEWNQAGVRLCTVATAAGVSPATSAVDTVAAAKASAASGLSAVLATWDLTARGDRDDVMPWDHPETVAWWRDHVIPSTGGLSRIWWNFANEGIKEMTSSATWQNAARWWLEQAQGYPNPVVLDLGVWGQDLGSVAIGQLDAWRDEMERVGLWHAGVHVGWHAYGSNPLANEGYHYSTMAEHLDQAARRGWRVTIGEYGQTKTPLDPPKAGPDEWNREAVKCLVTDTYGPPLAEAYGVIPFAWIGSGDTTSHVDFGLTVGAVDGDRLGRPMWQITAENSDETLTDFGRKHWRYSRG